MATKRNTSYKTDGPTPNEQVRASLKNVLEQAFQNIAAVCDEHAEKKLLPGEVYEKPWITFGNPHNMVTKHHYRGVNRLGCMAMVRKFNDDRFLTFEAVWGINDDLARWKELAEAMRFGRLMETDPLPQDDPKVRKPDITRARTLLGWEPKVALREGLKLSIDWFKANPQ